MSQADFADYVSDHRGVICSPLRLTRTRSSMRTMKNPPLPDLFYALDFFSKDFVGLLPSSGAAKMSSDKPLYGEEEM